MEKYPTFKDINVVKLIGHNVRSNLRSRPLKQLKTMKGQLHAYQMIKFLTTGSIKKTI